MISCRKWKVKLGKCIISGTLQWSVFCLTLFVIFVNDLTYILSSIVQIYADNANIYTIVNDIGDTILQQDLINLQQCPDIQRDNSN